MAFDDEKARSRLSDAECNFYLEGLQESASFRDAYKSKMKNIVKANEMPMERSPDGLIKHIIHEKMDTMEMCIDAYMQFLEPGKGTGKSRHLTEEIVYVVEGRGYDLHWDVDFDCKDEFEWEWKSEPKKFEWKEGDFIYVPPYVIHQRFNADPDNEARVVVVNSRIIKKMGFDWFDQLENAEGFEDVGG
jgi:gentisate 1,2-dioxygenase